MDAELELRSKFEMTSDAQLAIRAAATKAFELKAVLDKLFSDYPIAMMNDVLPDIYISLVKHQFELLRLERE